MNMENDKQAILLKEMYQLMSDLSSDISQIGDWKVIKIYEARMHGKDDPYDFDELSAQRQAARVRINEIQEELEELDKE